MTKGEKTMVGVGLGLAALALLPREVRGALFDGLCALAANAAKQLPETKRMLEEAQSGTIWEEVDVSDLTVH